MRLGHHIAAWGALMLALSPVVSSLDEISLPSDSPSSVESVESMEPEPTAEPTITETPEPTADPASPDAADPLENSPEEAPLIQLSPVGVGPQAGETGCSYANAGSGNYASTLCWLDLSSITTQYQQKSISQPACTKSGNNYVCKTTVTWVPMLGEKYGSAVSVTGQASHANQTSARNTSATNALNELAKTLFRSGSSFYGPISKYPLKVRISDAYTLEAELSITAAAGSGGLAVIPSKFPTYGGSFLGNNGFYTIANSQFKPALYQGGPGTTTATLSNIKLTSDGVAVTGYSIVVADAESSDNSESITWTASGAATPGGKAFTWLPNDPKRWASASTAQAKRTYTVGNACGSNSVNDWATGAVASPFTCVGLSTTGVKTGTAMLQASPASASANFTVTQQMVGGGREAVAFGVITAGGQVNVKVAQRIVGANGAAAPTDFDASVRRVGDAVPFAETAAEGTALSATTDPQNFPLASGSQVLSFESRARQNDSIANAYRATWSCKKSTSSGIEQWPSSGTRTTPPSVATDRDFLTIGAGEFIDCTVTYTPPYLTLKKAVDQAGTAAADLPAAWKLTATDAAGVSLVNGVANGTKTAVVPGTYTLSEAAGTTSWRYGYRWSGLSCTGAGVNATLNRDEATDTVRDASVSVAAGGDVTCTFTNTANEPRLDLTKTAFYQGAEFGSGRTIGTDDPGTPGPGSTITYALTFDNSKGTAAIAVDHIDYLRDVLDDADYVGNIRYGQVAPTVVASSPSPRGISAVYRGTGEDASNPRLLLTGAVPARATLTVFFDVVVKADETNWQKREKGAAAAAGSPSLVGFELNNYLVKNGDKIPAGCQVSGEGSRACTSHPILAVAMEKDSQPLNGASLHAQGDLHYKITLRRLNPRAAGEIKDIVISDDLTSAFKAGRWFPSAPVPYPGKQRGIYFYDAAGQPVTPEGEPAKDAISGLGAEGATDYNRLPNRATDGAGKGAGADDISAADAYVPAPTFTPDPSIVFPEHPVGACTKPSGVPGPDVPDCFKGTWNLTTGTFTMGDGVAYAEVWFSVRVGFATGESTTDILWSKDRERFGSDPSGNWQDYWMPLRQVKTMAFTNTARVVAASKTPVSCGTDPTRQDPVLNPTGSLCTVYHKVEGNYFVIRKDLLFRDSVTGSMDRYINMVGQEFSLEYLDPTDGVRKPIDQVMVGGEPLMCADWDQPGVEQIGETCARFRPIAAGAQTGRWRADRLPPGMYWLTETKAPTHRRDRAPAVDASGKVIDPLDGAVEVAGAQVLADSVEFRIADGTAVNQSWVTTSTGGGIRQFTPGEGQLDVFALPGQETHGSTGVLGRCTIPYGGEVSDLPTACINPTGYVMVLTDVAAMQLPFAGGAAITTVSGGLGALGGALIGMFWWRRKQSRLS